MSNLPKNENNIVTEEHLVSENNVESYGAESIKVLKGLDAVRKRPGMYIGDTDDGSGLHHMVYEVVDNAIDESLAGHCDLVKVILNLDGSVSVSDNGRGIPVDIHKGEGISAAEVIMTQLHAGGKFDQNSYKVSGGLHGVGVSVVNALSDWLVLNIWRQGKEYLVRFTNGVADEPLQEIGEANGKKGSMITFYPSKDTFSNINFDLPTLEHRLRELAFLNSGVRILLEDHRGSEPYTIEFLYDGGTEEFAKYVDRAKICLHPTIAIIGEQDNITLDLAMGWNDSYHENILCFTNNIRQRDGGRHEEGFKAALTRSINNYATEKNLFKKEKIKFTGDDIREGLTTILSVKVPDPKFSSQTKDKLVSSEVRPVVESLVSSKLSQWLEEHPSEAKIILAKVLEAAAAREAARRARELTRKKDNFEIANLAGKLTPCQSKNPAESEVFILEGESAAGSAKQARTRETQAILPLKGKILNVEKTRFDKMLASQEIGTLITALGGGIGREDFNIEKVRYHKIIIMTDADVDGSHIRTLLLTFFYRHMREIIEKGYLYIAQPPLYKIRKGSNDTYLKDEKALQDYLINVALEDASLQSASTNINLDKTQLLDLINKIIKFKSLISYLSRKIHGNILEAASIAGLFDENTYNNQAGLNNAIESMRLKLNNYNNDLSQKDWSIEHNLDRIILSRSVRGINEQIFIDKYFIQQQEVITLANISREIADLFNSNDLKFVRKSVETSIFTPLKLLEFIMEIGKKGIVLQRFKGLGEMNAEQLWDTTLNPETRTLLQVRINHFDDAEEIFSTLMGSVVEPRRDFIYENALKVANLDV